MKCPIHHEVGIAEKNGLIEFQELIKEIAELPEEKKERVCTYAQGVLDASRCKSIA